MGPQGIIDLSDKMIYEENSDWIIFNHYFLKLLKSNDYDAFVFMYIIWLNKHIEQRLNEKCAEMQYDKLDDSMRPSEMAEKMESIKEWQSNLREELYVKVGSFIDSTKKLVVDNRMQAPDGLSECLSIIGRNLSYSATLYDEKFERDWDVFNVMLSVEYSSFAKENIKKEYQEKYFMANKFIKEYSIFIPKFYILCWDLYKTADRRKYNHDEYEHNYKRIANILSVLPEIYRLILSGNRLMPSKERIKDGGMVSLILDVPFYRFFPTFVKEEKRYGYWDNYKHKDGSKKRVCHPMHQVMLPCTSIFTRTDIDLYLESAYRQVEFLKIKKMIDVYEAGVEGSTEKTIDGVVDFGDSVIPNKEGLLDKLSKRSRKTVELLNSLQDKENKNYEKEVRAGMMAVGFSRKLYYDLFSYYSGNRNTSVPDKDTIIALACCMGLGMDNINNLLISAGYVLSPAMERDIIIKHFIESGHSSLEEVNKALEVARLRPIKGKSKINKV